jgi:hypothetical protein
MVFRHLSEAQIASRIAELKKPTAVDDIRFERRCGDLGRRTEFRRAGTVKVAGVT